MRRTPNPRCPICRGRGWFDTGLYGFEADPQPCPDCNPCTPPTRAEIAFLALCFVCLFGLMLWGSR